MNREYFINTLTKLDDFFLIAPYLKDYIETKMLKNHCKTYKEYYKFSKDVFSPAKIDIKRIKNITLSTNKKLNPFIEFYKLDTLHIEKLFLLLHKTQKAIEYYDKYSEPYRNKKDNNTKGTKSNNIKHMIEMIEDIDTDVKIYKYNSTPIEGTAKPKGIKTIEYLEEILISLENKHYTKNQLFQNFLFEMYSILENKLNIPKKRKVDIVNIIIKEYFDEKEKKPYSTKRKINNYVTLKYTYETLYGITLTHQK